MSEPRFTVGIDLGTSNCALAYARIAEGNRSAVRDFPIPQLIRPGEVSPRPLFPSAIYLPSSGELDAKALQLPWGDSSNSIAGELARWQGAKVPGRLVTSAKSWLCHEKVDRTAGLLPWGAPDGVPKISPVHASSLLLAHMRRAWDHAHPDAPLPAQDLVITVPASFDEIARALTVNAAREAGLEKFTLIEEPQAAFYHYTSNHRTDLTSALANIRLVLVIDVGGGTSDFTLVETAASPEGPLLRRIAVGEHLILGGDNMDAAIARAVEQRLVRGDKKLSSAQWSQLLQQARQAKEALLADEAAPPVFRVSLLSEGSKLFGGAFSQQITREEVETIVLDGFFPASSPHDSTRKTARAGIQELGLPFAQDPAITRQIARFLQLHAASSWQALGQSPNTSGLPRPDAILLNGGVFNSPEIRQRLLEIVSSWWPQSGPIALLDHESLDLAVARGAAYYGLVRRGFGQKIGGGAAHAFYIGLGTPNQPGANSALCLIPRGQEEDQWVELAGQPFHLALGRPVQFPIYTTASDRIDRPGQIVQITEELNSLPPLHTLLKSSSTRSGQLPVHLKARLTEIGTLELWCVGKDSQDRWRLEFELRGNTGDTAPTITEAMPPRFAEARTLIEHFYGKSQKSDGPKSVKHLWPGLESILGSRDGWTVPVLRELWSALHAGQVRRRRSEDHERVWFQLAGFTLRPGRGYPLDEWRCEQTFQIFKERVQFQQFKPNWAEFWILWRRIASGLPPLRQTEIWEGLKPHLAHRLGASDQAKPKGVQPEGADEMLRLAVSLEHLDAAEKVTLGNWLCAYVRKHRPTGGPWGWSLGRLGTRAPLYGSTHQVIAPATAEAWLHLLLETGLHKLEGAAFAAAQIARMTGDRARDVDGKTRARVVESLHGPRISGSWIQMVSEVVALDEADEARALGDTIPPGLQLIEPRPKN